MHIKRTRTIPLAATAAAALAIVAAPIAAADNLSTEGATVTQTNGNAQVVATPGPTAQQAGQLQQPFGGDNGFLLFHH